MYKVSAMTPGELHRTYVQALLDRLNEKREEWFHGSGNHLPIFLQDYATLGIHAQRQSGGTYWMMTEFIKHPEAIMIVPSENIARWLIETYTTGIDPISQEPFPRLQPGQATRIYSINQYMTGASAGSIEPGDKATFIMEAGKVFSRVRIAKFYQWLAAHVDYQHTVFRLN